MDGPSDEAWVELRRFASARDAEQHALVLVAIGIGSRLVPRDGGIGLFVAVGDAVRADRELADYARENERDRPRSGPSRALRDGIDGALAYCVVIVLIDAAASRGAFGRDWLTAGAAQAGRIVEGEWWRAVTALGLHVDLGHIAANLGWGALFGVLLSQLVGPGLAWLTILMAGSLGNLANAYAHAPAHSAVGASTAVFGAVGLLSMLVWRRQADRWRRGLRRWLPLAAGVMLLAYLGFGGERVDFGAHIAGFIVGLVLGGALNVFLPRLPQGRAAQLTYGGAAAASFTAAWLVALAAAPA